MCKYAHACSYVQCMCFTVTPAVIDTWKNFYHLQSCHLAQRLSKRYFLCNLFFYYLNIILKNISLPPPNSHHI